MDMRIDLTKAALQLTPDQENSGRLSRAPFVPGRKIGRPVLQKSRKQWVDGPTKMPSKPCAIVTPSPSCNDARRHWLNDQPIWINSPRACAATLQDPQSRTGGSAWEPSRSLSFTI